MLRDAKAAVNQRRSFIRRENIRLDRFLGGDELLVGWRRSYRCRCGFVCGAPGEIWDHTQVCNHKEE